MPVSIKERNWRDGGGSGRGEAEEEERRKQRREKRREEARGHLFQVSHQGSLVCSGYCNEMA